MREKKYIDRLYQEKFREFEAAPREAVWKSISSKLKEKEEKKPLVRPLWSRMAGIAAVVSLLLLIGDWILQPQQSRMVNNEEQVRDDANQIIVPEQVSVAVADEEQQNGPADNTMGGIETKEAPQILEKKKSPVSKTSSLSVAGIERNPSSEPMEGSLSMVPELEDEKNSPSIFEGKSIFDELELLADEETVAEKVVGKRMEISTNASPIYYGNFGKGNFLGSQFDKNSSKGEVTYSYGINVAYALSEKLKIRSGISKVSMSYNTSNIAYQSMVDPLAISSVNYKSGGEVEVVLEDLQTRGHRMELFTSKERASFGSIYRGLLNQKIGYLEVPVELEYKLIDSKFEINIIGGASTLFLDENMVSVNSGNLSTHLGEANNLNNISFSTNIGLGVDYNLTSQFKLNLEPMFKYQINTFSTSSTGSQPFYLGVYSGFSFEF